MFSHNCFLNCDNCLRCKKAEICLVACRNIPLVLNLVMEPWLCVFRFIYHILPNGAMWILLPVLTGAVNSADVFKEQSALIPRSICCVLGLHFSVDALSAASMS